jgi:uncharacterized membrane protein
LVKSPPTRKLRLLIFGPGGRLGAAFILGAAIAWFVRSAMPFPFGLAVGWIAGVVFFLASTAIIVGGATPQRIRAHARQDDPYRPVILLVVVAAASVSLIALGFLLQKNPADSQLATGLRILIAGVAVLASWTLTHTMFALHYAHLYYGDDPLRKGRQDRRGLKFPDEKVPDFWDFLYYAFVVGMTCQVSDVQVSGRHMRRLTLGHGVLAFFFNAIILALAVNFIAGAI